MYEKNKRTQDLERALLLLDRTAAESVIQKTLLETGSQKTISDLITATLERIGTSWSNNQISLSQVYMSGVIAEELIDHFFDSTGIPVKNRQKIAIGVFEDFHSLGKRILYSSLKASGYELIDLGAGVDADQVIQAVVEKKIEILLLSVLMLPSALKIKGLKEPLAEHHVTLVVGGAPFNYDPNLWVEVGAYAMGKNSEDAIRIIQKLKEVPS